MISAQILGLMVYPRKLLAIGVKGQIYSMLKQFHGWRIGSVLIQEIIVTVSTNIVKIA